MAILAEFLLGFQPSVFLLALQFKMVACVALFTLDVCAHSNLHILLSKYCCNFCNLLLCSVACEQEK